MATLVLGAVGTAIGGPLGGAIGSVLGNQFDQAVLAPRRNGPRLGALTVQTSAYGQPIPKLFGTLRVAGTVIWATDLREEKHKSGGGKGRPKTTSYSYSASFAVALSGRPIRGVRRIWADGKLLRGIAGDWKSETGFRLHLGDEGQAVDPLLAAAEGAGGTPAYRGLAYAVFEDLQLADFGNRIPSLTFEVEADAAPVPLAQIAAELSDGAAAGETAAALGGYAAGGDSVRGAIAALARAIPLAVRDDGDRLLVSDAQAAPITLPAGELGSGGAGARADRRAVDRQAAGTLPDEVTVTYYEPSRDFQAGLQRARRGGPGRRVEAIELPAALEAGAAKAIAERRLADSWAERTTAAATLPWRRLDLRAADVVDPGDGVHWHIARWTLEGMVLALKLRAAGGTGLPAPVAQPGRATPGDDQPIGQTRIALLDLPPLDDGAATPQLWLAAAGTAPGWRRAAVTMSIDGGTTWADVGSTAAPAVIGMALTSLPPGDPAVFDTSQAVEVELLHEAMLLLSRDDAALAAGANLAMLDGELIQFGIATALGRGRWRLSRLLRGRRGSEDAMAGHLAGGRFVLVEQDALLPIAVASDRIGAEMRVIASGIADPTGEETAALVSGRALRPPAPVHLRAEPLPGGGLRLGWTRRSRLGWAWNDGRDPPTGEDGELYRLTVTPSLGAVRVMESDRPTCDYTAAMMLSDGAVGATTVVLSVVQLGVIGASPAPATATFTLGGERI